MTHAIRIPHDYRDLIGLLRDAVNRRPPPENWQSARWPEIFRLAQQQGVAHFLYPWLAEHAVSATGQPNDSTFREVVSDWRSLYLASTLQSIGRQRELAAVLSLFSHADIPVIPLKGAWLCEQIYDDPAQRSMSDLDLLVRRKDVEACHALLSDDGYFVKHDTLLNPFSPDQAYFHTTKRMMLELHWQFTSDAQPTLPKPDVDAVWKVTRRGVLGPNPICVLPPEDQLAHLVQHILHHRFAVPLRGYLDIALFLRKFGAPISSPAIEAAARRWRVGQAIPFIARLTAELFDSPMPSGLSEGAARVDADRLTALAEALFRLPPANARICEQTLLQLRNASPLTRLRLIVSRVFMPRAYLSIRYPYARHRALLPLAWVHRAADLIRNRREDLREAFGDTAGRAFLDDARTRESTVCWLLREKERPG